MPSLTTKHYISFFIIVIVEILSLIFSDLGVIIPIFSVCICYFLVHSYLHESFMNYGVHWNHILHQFVCGLILAFSLLFITNPYLIGDLLIFIHVKTYLDIATHLTTAIYAISEEIIFRGFLLNFFNRLTCNSYYSILISALLFGIIHYPLFQNLHLVAFAFIIGFVFSYLRLKKGETFSLFSLSLAHTIFNTFCM